jgi:hypothetical protein
MGRHNGIGCTKNIQQSTCREDYEGVVSLDTILMQLHHRYELGFIPPASDGKRHELRVELTEAATGEHKGVRLG